MAQTNTERALRDVAAGASNVHAWLLLAQDDVASRYRRTKLGPFWLTLSHAATIAGITLSFSIILRRPVDEYFVYLAAGMTVWVLLSGTLNDAPNTFIRGKTLLESYELPASLHVFRLVLTHLIIFAHNMIIYVVALAFIKNVANWNTLLVIPGLFVLASAATGYSAVLGFIGARFRDVAPAMTALTGMLFMFTPIFWEKPMLRDHEWIALVNPLYHLIEVVRAPLLGLAPTPLNWAVACGLAATSLALGAVSFIAARRSLTYWL